MSNLNINILKGINSRFKQGNDPKKWYHGSPVSFDKFDIKYRGSHIGKVPNTMAGFWFSDNRQIARGYADMYYHIDPEHYSPGFVRSVYIAAKNIIDINLYGQHPDDFMFMPDKHMAEKLIKFGYKQVQSDIALPILKEDRYFEVVKAFEKHNNPIFRIDCDFKKFWNMTKEYDAILFRNSSENNAMNNNSYVIVNDTSLIIDANEQKLSLAKMRSVNHK